MSLVVVMLYDFQDRKFLPRQYSRAKEFINEVRDVETYLLRYSMDRKLYVQNSYIITHSFF